MTEEEEELSGRRRKVSTREILVTVLERPSIDEDEQQKSNGQDECDHHCSRRFSIKRNVRLITIERNDELLSLVRSSPDLFSSLPILLRPIDVRSSSEVRADHRM